MSQHRERTQVQPSIASIVVAWSAVVASSIGAAYLFSLLGYELGEGVLLGALMGSLSTVLTLRAVVLTTDRHAAQERDRREVQREEDRQAAQEVARERNTGTWVGGGEGQTLSVRWEPSEARYWVKGWLDEDWQVPHEVPWSDVVSLAQTLDELELSEDMTPLDTEGTHAVRARLMLPELVGPEQPAPFRSAPVPMAHRYVEVPPFSGFTPVTQVQDPGPRHLYDEPAWVADRTEVVQRPS